MFAHRADNPRGERAIEIWVRGRQRAPVSRRGRSPRTGRRAVRRSNAASTRPASGVRVAADIRLDQLGCPEHVVRCNQDARESLQPLEGDDRRLRVARAELEPAERIKGIRLGLAVLAAAASSISVRAC